MLSELSQDSLIASIVLFNVISYCEKGKKERKEDGVKEVDDGMLVVWCGSNPLTTTKVHHRGFTLSRWLFISQKTHEMSRKKKIGHAPFEDSHGQED
ncbi:hypothetical protein L2E82_02487 [Cichorium intybus]|uniref:Uncharacterized protein n=1 Tax=Cichorium intybus TaxID=13427 RepID=A0ACB9H1E0_CICIN|nr:hypothetical protein L2E82_02487 [Cichorium intybus]